MPSLSLEERVCTVWAALLAAGETPSVRKVYTQVRGNYTAVAAAVRTLRTAAGESPELAETPEGPAARAVAAAQTQLTEAEARLRRLQDAIAEVQQEVATARAAVVDLERRALDAEDVSEALKAARQRRWEATQLAEVELPALVPAYEQALATAQEALTAAQVEALREDYNRLAAGRPALWDAVEQALHALLNTLHPLLEATVEHRAVAQVLGIAYPSGPQNPDRLLGWVLCSRLHTLVPPPPARLAPGEHPVVDGSLAQSDAACRPLSPEMCQLLRAEGPPIWLRYVGATGHAWSLESVGLQKAVWRHPTPFAAREVAAMRQHPKCREWVRECEESTYPPEPR